MIKTVHLNSVKLEEKDCKSPKSAVDQLVWACIKMLVHHSLCNVSA